MFQMSLTSYPLAVSSFAILTFWSNQSRSWR